MMKPTEARMLADNTFDRACVTCGQDCHYDLFVIAVDGGDIYAPTNEMEAFKGTWHDLLVHISTTYGYSPDPDGDPESDKALYKRIEAENGDGCAFVKVWSVGLGRQVIGKDGDR